MFYIFPVTEAYAQNGPPPGVAGIASLVPLLLIGAVFYFLLIRPQQKRMKEHREMLTKLNKGDHVATSGGLHGRISSVGEDTVTMEIAEGVKVKVTKDAVVARKPHE